MSIFGIKGFGNIFRQWGSRKTQLIDIENKKFLTAVENNEITEVSNYIDNGINVNYGYAENGVTALHIVAEKGDIHLLLMLVNCPNIKIDPISLYGFTPLHTACMFQRYEVAKILLEKEANPNQVDNFDKTCLHLVAITNHIRLAKLLIKFEAQINVIDYVGNTPLHLAIDTEYMPMIKLLLLHGADPNIQTKRMPLFLDCVLQCHSDMQLSIIKLLLAHGIDYNVIEPISNRNAMHFVAISGYVPLAYMLLKLDCCPDLRDIFKLTPESIAIRHFNYDLADLLRTFELYGNVELIPIHDLDILEAEETEENTQ